MEPVNGLKSQRQVLSHRHFTSDDSSSTKIYNRRYIKPTLGGGDISHIGSKDLIRNLLIELPMQCIFELRAIARNPFLYTDSVILSTPRYGIKTVVCHHSGNLVVTRFAIVTVSAQGSCDSIYPVAVPMFFLDSFDSSTES